MLRAASSTLRLHVTRRSPCCVVGHARCRLDRKRTPAGSVKITAGAFRIGKPQDGGVDALGLAAFVGDELDQALSLTDAG